MNREEEGFSKFKFCVKICKYGGDSFNIGIAPKIENVDQSDVAYNKPNTFFFGLWPPGKCTKIQSG